MMNFEEASKYIGMSSVRGSILGLSRIQKLCEILDNPQNAFEVIHIAGTNGKGSTGAFIAAVLNEASYLTGMYYSPALCGIKDHYTVAGKLISDEDYAKCVSIVASANEELYHTLGEYATQFELETAIAFVYFREKGCKYAVIETGLGGRDDATNVIRNEKLCVFTSISYDHMAILGNTIYDIASVKAGIITSPCKVVAFADDDEAVKAIREACDFYHNELNLVYSKDIICEGEESDLTISYKNYKSVKRSLCGAFQRTNVALAIEAIDALIRSGLSIDEAAIRNGLMNTYWPFRYEKISDTPLVYVDGAHNKDAADKLYDTISKETDKQIILVLGMFKDKDYEYVIGKLAPLATNVFTLTVPDANRALDATIISDIAGKYCDKVKTCLSIEDAARSAIYKANELDVDLNKAMVLACGSLSYLNEFKESVAKYHG